ncbi:hypothetical protein CHINAEXTREME_07035 [Halobiforma lacisalsi AJ5]|uniref:Nucleotidyltransferase n=1 Tax=Natronobacterium lacisalsi AJ5 TaxID=358396 RepID=M0LU52_NATLA|nr:hypothetical protein [Halobiforma lacisalsi]APW97543.1 hypothetical protein CHINAEXTREME_07035 [Halobiforma lacisalsi AJ5]EMA37077.1 hypothetical protein C445_02516 [Halobiforma lacisalsi AJ5]
MTDNELRLDGDSDRAVDAGFDEEDGIDAAEAFAARARQEHGDAIDRLVVFGDAVRDDRGVHASVDVLIVLEEADEHRERDLERLGETVGIEHGIVFSVYVLPADRFEENRDHPLVERALEEGESYV